MIAGQHTAGSLRRELSARNLSRADAMTHEVTYGSVPSVVYTSDELGHGNFLPASYRRILADSAWRKRLDKAYTGSARLPRSNDRRRSELECAASSDALLMNIFCYPGAMHRADLVRLLGIEAGLRAEFGVRVLLPMLRDEVDRTEVDMRIDAASGPLFFEAKLTETGFQLAAESRLRRYRDVEEVFDVEGLPRQGDKLAGYQLVRGVLAARAAQGRFIVLADARRTDLAETWFRVLAAVRSYDLRSRMALLTWQEMTAVMPATVRKFLDVKYGIV